MPRPSRRKPRTRIDRMDGPVRTCAGCRKRKPQGDLIRINRGPDDSVTVDPPDRKGQGRGAYVCFDRACVDRALRTGSFHKVLRYEGVLPEDLKDGLLSRIAGSEAVQPARTPTPEGADVERKGSRGS